MRKRIDYSGKIVNVGIDVHKKSYSIVCRCEKQEVKKATIPASPDELVKFLEFHFSGAKICSAYEAGFSGFVLHRVLSAGGINSIVVNPSSIEVAANDKSKTDTRDARKLSTQLEDGRLKAIFIPTIDQEKDRLLTRTRSQLVKERSRVGNQFKSRLSQFGLIPFDDETLMSVDFIDDYLRQPLDGRLHRILLVLAEIWKQLNNQIKDLDKEIRKKSADNKIALVYRSIPGVGPLISLILAQELGDMSQFTNEKGLFKHTGLIPTEYSSGEKRRQGHITRQGSSRLRWILTEVAWHAIRLDPRLKEDFARISTTRGKKRAIVAIARKIIGRARACFKKGETYQLGFGMVA